MQNNNNIVWKNIAIVDTDGDGGRYAEVIIANFGGEARKRLRFTVPGRRRGGFNLSDWGYVLVELRGGLEDWARQQLEGSGFHQLPDGRLMLTKPGAELVGPPLEPNCPGVVHLRFVPDGRKATGSQVFALDLVELDDDGRPIGGQRFLLKTAAARCPSLREAGRAGFRRRGMAGVYARLLRLRRSGLPRG